MTATLSRKFSRICCCSIILIERERAEDWSHREKEKAIVLPLISKTKALGLFRLKRKPKCGLPQIIETWNNQWELFFHYFLIWDMDTIFVDLYYYLNLQ